MKISIKYLAILLSFTVMAGGTLSAQTFPSLLIGPDAVGSACGAASVAKSEGASAMDGNVALMSLQPNMLDAAVSFGKWQPDFADNTIVNAGVRYRVSDGLALGLSFRDRLQNSYDITTSTGTASRDGSYTPKEYNIAVGASYAILPGLSAGVTLRYMLSDLAPGAKSSAFGADIAAAYYLAAGRNGFSAGLSVNNLGTELKYGENKYSLPSMVKAGAAYSYCLDASAGESVRPRPCAGAPFKASEPSFVSVTAEVDALFAGAVMAGAGVEYSLRNSLFVRAGYHYGDSAKAVPSYASVGIGLGFYGVSVNASYIFASDVLGNSFGVSLGCSF